MQVILAIHGNSGRGSFSVRLSRLRKGECAVDIAFSARNVVRRKAGPSRERQSPSPCAQHAFNVVFMTFMSFLTRERNRVTAGNPMGSRDGTAVALSWFVGTHPFR